MKNRHITFLILISMVLISGFAYAVQAVPARQQQIEENYMAGLEKVYEDAISYARRFTTTERLLWTEFLSNSKTPYSDSFSLYLPFIRLTTLDHSDRHFRASLKESYSLHNFASFLLDEGAYQLLTDVAESKGQSMKLRTQARSILREMDLLQKQIDYLKKEKQTELAKLKRAKEVVVIIEQKQKAPEVEVQVGVVSAISHDKDNSFCMIDGVDEILKAGVTIETQDIKVVQIAAEQVTFSKNGKQWQQKLGADADSRWK